MTDEDSFVGQVLTSDQIFLYGERELDEKVTSFILYLVKTHLSKAAYNKHVATLKDYYEEEDIWANDIDVGQLKLQ